MGPVGPIPRISLPRKRTRLALPQAVALSIAGVQRGRLQLTSPGATAVKWGTVGLNCASPRTVGQAGTLHLRAVHRPESRRSAQPCSEVTCLSGPRWRATGVKLGAGLGAGGITGRSEVKGEGGTEVGGYLFEAQTVVRAGKSEILRASSRSGSSGLEAELPPAQGGRTAFS